MDKETELAYLKNLLASSQDVVNVLETIAAQFKSMEQSSQSTSQSCIRSRVDMVTVFNNWSTVFSLASKAQAGDVTVVTIPDPKERDDSKQ